MAETVRRALGYEPEMTGFETARVSCDFIAPGMKYLENSNPSMQMKNKRPLEVFAA